MRSFILLILTAAPAFGQIVPGPQPVKAIKPAEKPKPVPVADAITATESSAEWVVTLGSRTFHVAQPETRESAVRLARLAAGVTAAPPSAGCSCASCDCTAGECGSGSCQTVATKPEPPAFTPLPLTQWYAAPAASTCPNGKCPNAAPTTTKRR